MNLIDRIEGELKTAMLEKDNERRDALRLILASLRSAEKELQRPLPTTRSCRCSSASGSGGSRRRRRSAAASARSRRRRRSSELAVLEEFMPSRSPRTSSRRSSTT